jgi:hypothetical protein
MHELTFASLKKHIGGEWDLVLFEGEVDNAQQMFKDVFIKTHHLWSEQKCNILFIDLDILALRSVDFFDLYKNFTMFVEITDQFYNCGLRYFPHTMDTSVWNTGLELYKNWDENCEWDREQLIYSKMLCSQPDFIFKDGPIASQFDSYDFKPEYFNRCKLLHFHSSRGPKQTFELMKKYSARLV